MAVDEWYYVQAGQRLGPVPEETLCNLISAGAVGGGDLVWSEGMTDWAAAAMVPTLAPAIRPASPPPSYFSPPYQAAPPQYNAPQYATSQYAAPQYPAPPYAVPAHDVTSATVNYYVPPRPGGTVYAGFAQRFVALLIDGALISVAFFVVLLGLAAMIGSTGMLSPFDAREEVGVAVLLFYLSLIVVPWLYFAVMESSPSQGTFGKRAMGLRVTDANGGRISFARATGRYFARSLSWIFLIGYVMAAFTERKQALHDILADCLVLQR